MLKTFDDDMIEWSVDDGPLISITLKDGTSWTKDIGCVACTAANVYSTPAIAEGMVDFKTTLHDHRNLYGGEADEDTTMGPGFGWACNAGQGGWG